MNPKILRPSVVLDFKNVECFFVKFPALRLKYFLTTLILKKSKVLTFSMRLMITKTSRFVSVALITLDF